MDVRRLTRTVGVVAAILAAVVVGVPRSVVAAGAVAAVAPAVSDRGTPGIAVGSLAFAASSALAASGLTAAESASTALAWLFAAAGVAGCLAAALDGEGVGSLLGAWTALLSLPVSVLALLTVASGPFRSLLGARLAFVGFDVAFFAVPVAIGGAAGWAALSAYREAGLPPWLLTAGPAASLAVWAFVSLPVSASLEALSAGVLADAAAAYVLFCSATMVVAASALAGATAAEDVRFRRGPAWAAAAVGPLALLVLVVVDAGPFLAAAVATVPPVAEAYGAVVETAASATAVAFLAALACVALAFAVTLPSRTPLVRSLVAGRPAGVGACGLLVAVALSGVSQTATVLAGGLAVFAWALLAPAPTLSPPPRTVLSRAGTTALAVAAGGVVATWLVGVVPRTDPGVGSVLLLAGVAVLGLAIR